MLICIADLSVAAGKPIPEWLDADLLMAVNYGPATPEMISRLPGSTGLFQDPTLTPVTLEEAGSRTIADRKVMAKLHDELFVSPNSTYAGFRTDWLDEDTSVQFIGITPFDYDIRSQESLPLLATEAYIINNLYRSAGTINTFQFPGPRPPMAPIVMDMIGLARYLFCLPSSSEPQPITTHLVEFAKSGLQSFPQHQNLDEIPLLEFLIPLFQLLTSMPVPREKKPIRWAQDITIPSPKLILGPNLLYPITQRYGALDEITASFIVTGPY